MTTSVQQHGSSDQHPQNDDPVPLNSPGSKVKVGNRAADDAIVDEEGYEVSSPLTEG